MANIAKHYGCTVSAISMMLKKHNVATRHKAIKPKLTYLPNFRSPLLDALKDGDVGLFVKTVNRLFASIPYDNLAVSARAAIRQSKILADERLYRSTILAFLCGCGVDALGEVHNNKGRSGLLISYAGNTWVIEIRVTRNDDCAAKVADAMKQINDNRYAEPYKNAKKVALAIDDKTRQVGEWAEG